MKKSTKALVGGSVAVVLVAVLAVLVFAKGPDGNTLGASVMNAVSLRAVPTSMQVQKNLPPSASPAATTYGPAYTLSYGLQAGTPTTNYTYVFSGSSGISQSWFDYGTVPAATGSMTPRVVPASTGTHGFSAVVSGLVPGTRYYFKACNTDGTQTGELCGSILSFVTPGTAPATSSTPGRTVGTGVSVSGICLPWSAPSITVLSPNGGETFNTGGQMTVTWRNCNVPTTQPIGISLVHVKNSAGTQASPDANGSPVTIFAGYGLTSTVGGVPNSGAATFTIPNFQNIVGDIHNYRVTVWWWDPATQTGGSDDSDANFLILPSVGGTPTACSKSGTPGALAETVFVADALNDRIQKFDLNGTYLDQWGSTGSGNGQFSYPSAIAVSNAGNVYVADANNNRVQEFTSNGTYITQWGTQGTGNGQFHSPFGIAVSSSGNVYVSDNGNKRIQEFTSSGTYITQWGRYGSASGQFDSPRGVAVDSSGNVYVADFYNNRVQKFTSSGAFITKWTVPNASDLDFDSRGYVYVVIGMDFAVPGLSHVQEFTSSGVPVAHWGLDGTGTGQFSSPRGIAFSSLDNLYVADGPSTSFANHRIEEETLRGVYVNQWGSLGSAGGQFNVPSGIAIACVQ